MKISISKTYAILGATLYASAVAAMPYQLDFSAHWGPSAESLQFDFGGVETLTIASIDTKKVAAADPLTHDYDNKSYQHLFTTDESSDFYKIANVVAQVSDDDGRIYLASNTYPDNKVSPASNKEKLSVKPANTFSFFSGNQFHPQAVPYPSLVWLTGLVLGLSGLTWRLFNLSKSGQTIKSQQK